MPYVYPRADDLDGHDLVGTHQCVALVQAFTQAPRTTAWRQGAGVRGQLVLTKGTAIAIGPVAGNDPSARDGQSGTSRRPTPKGCGCNASTPKGH